MKVHASILDLIGNTPMVDVSPAEPQPGRAHPGQAGGPTAGRLGEGPHSALKMIEEAEADGTLAPGKQA